MLCTHWEHVYGVTGERVLSFQKKRKNQRKVVYVFLPQIYLSSDVLWSYIREVTLLSCAACLAQSQRRSRFSLFAAHASYNLYSFRDSANDLFWFRQFSPAPCSPPLGGSIADSAVRFTPAESRAGAKTGRPAAKLDV